jgi:hypothetical protein
MPQTSLAGQLLPKWYCIHCPWEGFNPKIIDDPDFRHIKMEMCPKCGWVTYNEFQAPGMVNLYPILKDKIKFTINKKEV